LYQYYHPDQLSTCYSSVYYRKNNYNLQSFEAFNNKTIYAVRKIRIAEEDIEVKSRYVPTFLHKVDSFKAIIGLNIQWKNEIKEAHRGQQFKAVLQLSNPLSYPIEGNNLFLNYTFFKSKNDFKTSENILLNEKQLSPGDKKEITIDLKFPEAAGKYRLIFSFDQPSMGPTFASPFFEIEVK
jgi:hypothetical protein